MVEPIILILGRPELQSVARVAHWLKSFEVRLLVTQTSDLVATHDVVVAKNGTLLLQERGISKPLFKVEAIWYYRDELRADSIPDDQVLLKKFSIEELNTLRHHLYTRSFAGRVVGNLSSIRVNKLAVIEAAEAVGLTTPDYLVTNSKAALFRFCKRLPAGVITKPMSENVAMYVDNTLRTSYVQLMEEEQLQQMPSHFSFSFFQQAIPQKTDVRLFYFNGRCYPMLIKNSPTLDYKGSYGKLLYEKCVLPAEIEAQVIALMHKLNLIMGALDFVIDAETGTYYFLEVNPNGKFELLSSLYGGTPEHEIANYLAYGTSTNS